MNTLVTRRLSKGLCKVAREAGRVAVLGIKPESKAGQPAFDIPKYLADSGIEVYPVPVNSPDLKSILGKTVYRTLVDIPGGPVDVVDVFRRPQNIPEHVDDIIAAHPRVVWLQSGIHNPDAEKHILACGIDMVVSRCLMVDRQTALMLEQQKALL